MKKDIKTLLIAGMAGILSLASCGDIDEKDRIILGEKEQYGLSVQTTMLINYADELFEVDDLHRMLIADFTGWKCVNCPNMADFLTTKITPDYPSVLVSLHMTSNSFSAGHIDGYNCPSADSILNWMAGETLASQIGLPAVSIDNIRSGKGVLNSDLVEIENIAQNRFKETNITKTSPRVSIGLNTEMTEDEVYNLSTLILAPGLNKVNLQLWLIEEGLISTVQYASNGIIQGYENHGIMRQVINGSYDGQTLDLTGVENSACVHHKLNIKGKGYKSENCRVVAIVSDVDTREVLNCLEVNL